MSKEQATEKWVVEVRRAHALEHRTGQLVLRCPVR